MLMHGSAPIGLDRPHIKEVSVVLNLVASNGETVAHKNALRGYHAVYRAGETNHCPGCGRSHWIVGRLLAECAFCTTALPLLDAGMNGAGLIRRHVRRVEEDAPLAA
jgi:hypothetical protein